MKKVFLLLIGLCFFLGSPTVAMDEYDLPYISFEKDATYNVSSAGGFINAAFTYSGTPMRGAQCKSKLNTSLTGKGYDTFITISYVDDGSNGYIGIDITPNTNSTPRSFTIGSQQGSIKVYQD